MRPSVLLFDVMDTLVRDPFWELPTFFGMPFEEIWKDKHPTAWVDFELGRIDNETFLERFFADGRDYDREGFLELFRSGYRWIEGAEELLAELRDAGVAMHTLSNYPSWYQTIEERLGLSRYLPWTFVSCKTGVRKPDPAAFLGPAQALALPPEACLFIDDRGSNCKGAAAVGMQALRFEGTPLLREQLTELGVLQAA